jgi:hypothetical protein
MLSNLEPSGRRAFGQVLALASDCSAAAAHGNQTLTE